jgi:hypothetical protein
MPSLHRCGGFRIAIPHTTAHLLSLPTGGSGSGELSHVAIRLVQQAHWGPDRDARFRNRPVEKNVMSATHLRCHMVAFFSLNFFGISAP